MRFPWNQQTVLITGASSGIGAAVAAELAKQGARVGLIARRQAKLEQVAAQLANSPGQAIWATADVTRADEIQAACDRLTDQLGGCDILIANAGIFRQTPVDPWDTRIARQVFAVNVTGVVNTVGAVLPGMVQRKSGHLVAISSIASVLGLPASAAYCGSKAAVTRFMESLRVDLRKHRVRVTTVFPGYVDTPLLTEKERQTRSDVVSVEHTARRIRLAIEQQKAEVWFPWWTMQQAHAARWLPPAWFDRIVGKLEPLENSPGSDDD